MIRLSVWMIRAALLHFGASAVLGALMLADKGVNLWPVVWRARPLHVDLMLTGWMIQFVMGVAYWILPRYTMAPRHGNLRLGWTALMLINGGVIAAAAGVWWGSGTLLLAGRVAAALAVVMFLLGLWPRVKPMIFT